MTATSRSARPDVVRGAAGAARFVRDAVLGFGREFLWKELREGTISLRGLSPAMRTVVVLSALLLVVGTISFAAGDVLRTGQERIVIPNGTPGRGSLVPGPLVPATFGALTIGCALLLAGALHAPPAVRVGVLALYTALAAAFAGLSVALEGTSRIPGWPAVALILGVFVTFAARWRRTPRAGLEFALLLVLAAGTFAISGAGLFRSDAITGSSFALLQLDLLLGLLVGLTLPLVVVAGLDAVGFGLDAAGWAVRFVGDRLSSRAVYVALVALVAWRAWDLARLVAAEGERRLVAELGPEIVGSGILVAAILAMALVIGRVDRRARAGTADEHALDHGSARVRLPLGIAYGGVPFLLVPVLLVLNGLAYLGIAGDAGVIEAVDAVASFMGRDDTITAYRILLGVVLLGIATWLARRGSVPMALFIGAVGVNDLITHGFARVDALGPLRWQGAIPLDIAWNALFLGMAAWWAFRRTLTRTRAERIFFLILLGAVLNHFDVFADPLSPLLGFAGVGFIVFGLVWGFLTGGGWANEHSTRFPRPSRVFLYLGYSLLSVAILNWFSVTHDIDELGAMTAAGENGVALLGYPLLYALFVLVLRGAIGNRPVERPEERPEVSEDRAPGADPEAPPRDA